MWRWYISSDSCYCLGKTTITFQVIPTLNIPPLSPLTLPLPLHLPYLVLSPHSLWRSSWLTWSAHSSVTGSLALWRKKLSNLHPLLKGEGGSLSWSKLSLPPFVHLSVSSLCLPLSLSPSSLHPPPPPPYFLLSGPFRKWPTGSNTMC